MRLLVLALAALAGLLLVACGGDDDDDAGDAPAPDATAAPPPVETFEVTSTADAVDADPGDGACDDGTGRCTLRAAIMKANAREGRIGITLRAGTYALSIPGGDEEFAATGRPRHHQRPHAQRRGRGVDDHRRRGPRSRVRRLRRCLGRDARRRDPQRPRHDRDEHAVDHDGEVRGRPAERRERRAVHVRRRRPGREHLPIPGPRTRDPRGGLRRAPPGARARSEVQVRAPERGARLRLLLLVSVDARHRRPGAAACADGRPPAGRAHGQRVQPVPADGGARRSPPASCDLPGGW